MTIEGSRLTVLEQRGTVCTCLCTCGKTVTRDWQSVRAGKTKSCGCLRRELVSERSSKPIDPGTVFGKLAVVEYRGSQCLCWCSCGNPRNVLVDSTKLRSGHTSSCGCYQREQASIGAIKIIKPGTVYGKLTVIEQAGDRCECRCDCGAVVNVQSKKLRSGHVKSCGCLKVDQAKKMADEKSQIFEPGEVAFNSLYSQYRAQAQIRQLSFELTEVQFRLVTGSNCRYCGRGPSRIKRSPGSPGFYTYNGVDRLDNSGGYTESNSVAACWECNSAKHDMSEQEFLKWASAVNSQQTKPQQLIVTENGAFRNPIKVLLRRYQSAAKSKGIAWNLTDEEFGQLIVQPCRYCTRPPHKTVTAYKSNALYTGIDRIENTGGYSPGNVAPCCWTCNNAKGSGSVEDLYLIAERVVTHSYANKQRQ